MLILALVLPACGGIPKPAPTAQSLGTPTPPAQGTAILPTPEPPLPEGPANALTVCMASEPASLFPYGPAETPKSHVLAAVAEGPFDGQGDAARPVILETLPSLTNGDLRVNAVSVAGGHTVVDASGDVVELARGVRVWTVDGATGLPASEPVKYSGSGAIQAVQLQATYRLLPGLYWSDGKPLTADDSVFSFEVAGDPATLADRHENLRTESYSAPDPGTVVWTGLPGYLSTDQTKHFWTPLPRHAYGGMPRAELLASSEANRSPLGWGPFRVDEWVDGEYIRVVPHPFYFRTAEGLPRLESVTFRFVPDPAEALRELREGGCDLATQDHDWPAQLRSVFDASASGELAAQFAPGTQWEHLDFNIAPAREYAGVSAGGLFQDEKVRQAFAFCIDRQAIVDDVWGGRGEVPVAYLPSSHPLFVSESITAYPFDPQRGLALLDEAGWILGEDGVRVKDGRRLSLALALNSPSNQPARSARLRTAVTLGEQLRANCGIETTLELLDAERMYAPGPEGVVFGREFDLAQFSWSVAGPDPICDVYLSTSLLGGSNASAVNNTGYSNPDFDAACQASLLSLDENGRRTAQAQATMAFTRDLPSIPLYFDLRVMVARPRVSGLTLSFAGSDLWNIEVASVED